MLFIDGEIRNDICISSFCAWQWNLAHILNADLPLADVPNANLSVAKGLIADLSVAELADETE